MGEKNMSWFKRRPRIKEQPKQAPHHTSPITERLLDDAKEAVRPKKATVKSKK
jgi:hypothetical protein